MEQGFAVAVMSIEEIKSIINAARGEEILEAIKPFEEDGRQSVKRLVLSALKKYNKYIDEKERLKKLSVYENALYEKGAVYIAGVDEVGRGPLAGPVVTAAVILKPDCVIEGIDDSKKLSPKKREELYHIIMKEAVAVSIGMEDNSVIDDINILQATLSAMKKAVEGLETVPSHILADAVHIKGISIPQTSIIKGDAKSISIAAASIVAKVTRDRMMVEMDSIYPGYGFSSNKGYGTKEHYEGIKKSGICPIHRKSFLKGII